MPGARSTTPTCRAPSVPLVPSAHAPPRRTILSLGILIASPCRPEPSRSTTPRRSRPPAVETNPFCFFHEQLCFDVQERARVEIRDNTFDFFNGHNDAADDTWLHRFRLGVLWKPASWLRFYVQGQDSREIDLAAPTYPARWARRATTTSTCARRMWSSARREFPLSLRAGRQQARLCAEERIIGIGDWNNFARTFDAVKVTYKQPGWQLDALSSVPSSSGAIRSISPISSTATR